MGDACGMEFIPAQKTIASGFGAGGNSDTTAFRRVATAAAILFAACTLAAMAVAGEVSTAGKGFFQPTTQYQSPPTPPAAPTDAAMPTSGTAGVTQTQQFESQPFNFPGERRRARTGSERHYSMPSIWPALLAVVVVCSLFCAVLYLVKKYLPGHRQLFAHPAMEVLGRTHLDQRRYISLLRVGKRILVLGVSADEIHSLSEITDEEEITGILEVARPKTEPGLTLFQRLFQRHVIDADAAEAREMAQARAAEIDEQMSSLRERVREIRGIEQPQPRKLDTVG